MDAMIGSIIDGKYRVLSLLGAGGLGSVYKAEQIDLSRIVAIKILHTNIAEDPEQIARFEQEAKILSELEHPHIVRVFSVGTSDSGLPYMTMEYLEGESLASRIVLGSQLSPTDVIRIGIQICEAAQSVHAKGIIHRDLKPQNVLLIKGSLANNVKVLDFGLSRVIKDTNTLQKLTQTGALVGSVHYMSPEVCEGRKADQRSDIYSLGCTLYECLSGKVPLDSVHPISIISMQLNEMPRALSKLPQSLSLPPGLERVVFKALQKEPENRFQRMGEFADALKLVLEGRSDELKLGTVKLSFEELDHSATRRAAFGKIIAAVAVVLIVLLGVLSQLKQNHAETKTVVSGARARSIENAKGFLAQAKLLKKQGREHQAETLALRALFSMSHRYPHTADDMKNAIADIEVLTGIAEIVHDLKISSTPETSIANGTGTFDQIKENDSCVMDKGLNELPYDRAVAEILLFEGRLHYAVPEMFSAMAIYSRFAKGKECYQFIDELREIGKPLIGDNLTMLNAYLMIAKAYALNASGDFKQACEQADLCRKEFRAEEKSLGPLDSDRLLSELYEFERVAEYTDGVKLTLEQRLPVTERLDDSYSGLASSTKLLLASVYANSGQYDRAIDVMRRSVKFEHSRSSQYERAAIDQLDIYVEESKGLKRTRKRK